MKARNCLSETLDCRENICSKLIIKKDTRIKYMGSAQLYFQLKFSCSK